MVHYYSAVTSQTFAESRLDMWGFGQTSWMRNAARSGIKRFEVKNPGSSIEIPAPDATLWRYMDLAKLLDLVINRRLFFSAVNTLGDRFEGQWSDRTLEFIDERHELWIGNRGGHVVIEDKRNHQRLEFRRDDPGWSVEQTIEHWHRLIRRHTGRGSTFVNCWYQEAEESEAMWKLFAGEKYGVAVRTTAAQLVGSFTERLPDYLGCVAYLAYDKDLMPVSEFPPVFYKRKAFMHEREVRAVVAPEQRVEQEQVENGSVGVVYGIDPALLIEAVVVSPYSPDWLLGVVRSAVGNFGIETVVEKSMLQRRPASEGARVTVFRPKAYFAYREGERSLRIWATSREHAREEARERWGLSVDDETVDVWTEVECAEGYAKRPNEYERLASRHNSANQNRVDPEQESSTTI